MMYLKFDTDDDAFVDNLHHESARILCGVAAAVANEYKGGLIFDSNGNRVGEWSLTNDKGE